MSDESDRVTLVNHGTTAVIYTGEGHSLDAGGRVEVDRVDAVGQHALDSGFLTVAEPGAGVTRTDDEAAEPAADEAETGAGQGDDDAASSRKRPRSGAR
jgi:hypothetical protein